MQATKYSIQALLLRNDDVGMHAVGRALVVLFQEQTQDEKRIEATKWFNNRGFTPNDAKKGTGMAQYYMRNNKLTEAQLAYWQKPARTEVGKIRITKYWRQLLLAAERKALNRNRASQDEMKLAA